MILAIRSVNRSQPGLLLLILRARSMKPAPFEYARPSDLGEACAILAAGDDARIIAGAGVLALFFREFRPSGLFRCVDQFELYRASCSPTGQTVALSPPLPQLEGHAYKVPVPQLRNLGDTAGSARSAAIICEDDHRMGPGHVTYGEIAQKGLGRFSHYEGDVVFSSSDNTDPNTNRR